MMIHAYDEVFLEDAMETLGAAVEYAVLHCDMDGQKFLDLFVVSGIAKEFEAGNPLFVSGMSGVELVREVFRRVGEEDFTAKELPYTDYPPEYWIGWILAYYQWRSGRTFEAILRSISYDAMRNLYGVLHEADPQKAADTFDTLLANTVETNLAAIRKRCGLSQSQLAARSGVSIRSIQLFEQRKSNINNAQYNNLKAIAAVLNCSVEELMDQRG